MVKREAEPGTPWQWPRSTTKAKMQSIILGLNFGLHDSSATLVVDGRVVAAAEEERFSREKHTSKFPRGAIESVVAQAGLQLSDITHAAYYWNTQGRLGERLVHHAKQCLTRLHRPHQLWRYLTGFFASRRGAGVGEMMLPGQALKRHFPGQWGDFKLQTLDHHLCHAASAYYPSGFDDAAILIVDGSAELESTSLYHGHGQAIDALERQPLPHSLGFFYGAVTEYLGFVRNHDEYKVMGMAAYGKPLHLDEVRRIVHFLGGLHFELEDEYFDQVYGGAHWYSARFPQIFGPARKPDEPITQHHFDIAASVQAHVEHILTELARHALKRTGSRNLCMAGGVALNCLANSRIIETLRKEGSLDSIYIHPAANDAGASLGAALAQYVEITGLKPPADRNPYLGPSFSNEGVLEALQSKSGLRFRKEADIESALARELFAGKVVCRFSGAMEWGPRALGNRSILANPARAEIREEVNVKVKLREEFRPFAPACMAEDFDNFFEGERNPYMLVVNRANEHARQTVPAVVHFDGTARVQCVDADFNPRFHRLLQEFKKLSGYGVLLNTSFNIQEPVVCTPAQALATFERSSMDCLAIEDYLVERVSA